MLPPLVSAVLALLAVGVVVSIPLWLVYSSENLLRWAWGDSLCRYHQHCYLFLLLPRTPDVPFALNVDSTPLLVLRAFSCILCHIEGQGPMGWLYGCTFPLRLALRHVQGGSHHDALMFLFFAWLSTCAVVQRV